MEGRLTCGQGLAANSALPAKLGELIASMADVLDAHTEALDLQDVNARREHDVYVDLVAEQRKVADQLRAIAGKMAGSRDLPMGRHDAEAMSSPKAVETFQSFVDLGQQVLALLNERAGPDERMLTEMRGARAGGG